MDLPFVMMLFGVVPVFVMFFRSVLVMVTLMMMRMWPILVMHCGVMRMVRSLVVVAMMLRSVVGVLVMMFSRVLKMLFCFAMFSSLMNFVLGLTFVVFRLLIFSVLLFLLNYQHLEEKLHQQRGTRQQLTACLYLCLCLCERPESSFSDL